LEDATVAQSVQGIPVQLSQEAVINLSINMKTYLTLLALAAFSFFGVSCDTVEYDDDHEHGRSAVMRETTTTIDPVYGTANTSTTTTRVDRTRAHDDDD
jgi:hypothetical protein